MSCRNNWTFLIDSASEFIYDNGWIIYDEMYDDTDALNEIFMDYAKKRGLNM